MPWIVIGADVKEIHDRNETLNIVIFRNTLMDFDYESDPEAYEQAIEALGYDQNFYDLEPEDQKKVAEVAEMNAILNGDTGSIAGMGLHPQRQSIGLIYQYSFSTPTLVR
jgi:hypothetical protein